MDVFSQQFLLAHAPMFLARKLESPRYQAPDSDDAVALAAFRSDMTSIVELLTGEILAGTYRPAPAEHRQALLDKVRTIAHFSLIDEFVMSAVGAWLQQALAPILSPHVYGFRAGYSDRGAVRAAARYIRGASPLYVVRRDISGFGESLQHERVQALAERYFPHEFAVRYLIGVFSEYRFTSGGGETQNERGLPTGSNLQLQIENLYLHELDLGMSEFSEAFYLRLGDDMLCMSPIPSVINDAAERIDSYLLDVGLEVNAKKSATFALVKPHQIAAAEHGQTRRSQFRFLGMDVFWDGSVRLPADKWRFMLHTLRSCVNSTAIMSDGALRFPITVAAVADLLKEEGRNPRFHSYLQKISSAQQLTELDRWIELMLGKAHFRPRFSKVNLKRTAGRKLRHLGLPSCLHLARVRGHVQ